MSKAKNHFKAMRKLGAAQTKRGDKVRALPAVAQIPVQFTRGTFKKG
ncbi:hypothetical protein [Mesorhizobium sp. M2A.F.Ca.ET.043.05.1.1]|nr:hypothetical protein [Mesorhizobium sp. M2A.F.Ca.ET.043.05.1.1]